MLLINPNEVINHAFGVDEKISSNAIRPTKIDIAQEHFIRPKIGDKLFDKITNGLHQEFNEEFIKPALAYFVKFVIIDELAIKISDDGLVLFSGDDSIKKNITDAKINTINSKNATKVQTNLSTEDNDKDYKRALSNNQTSDTTTNGSTKEVLDANKSENRGITGDKTHTVTTTSFINEDKTVYNEGDNADTIEDSTIDKTIKNSVAVSQGQSYIDEVKTMVDVAKETSTDINTNENQNLQNNKTITDDTAIENKKYITATPQLIHKLQIRTLADANVLMNKAIRFLYNNAEMFQIENAIVKKSKFFF